MRHEILLLGPDNAPAPGLYRSAGRRRATPDPLLFEIDLAEGTQGDAR